MKVDFVDFSGNERNPNRLAERYKRIIAANIDHIKGKSILDLASNNGRWSYAACAAEAARVQGIEGRLEEVQIAEKLIAKYDYTNKCSFEMGDIYDWLFSNQDKRYDTVFCLGIYYHVLDHYMLLRLMARLQPECIIIDSGFVRTFDIMTHIHFEDPARHLNALPAYPDQKSELVGSISLGMMLQMAWNCGYSCEPVIWDPKEVEDKSAVQDYMSGRRFTLRLIKTEYHNDPDWMLKWKKALTVLAPRFEYLFNDEKKNFGVDNRAKVRDFSTQKDIPPNDIPPTVLARKA